MHQLQHQLESDDEDLVTMSRRELKALLSKQHAVVPIPKPLSKSPKRIAIKLNNKKQKPYQPADVNYWTVQPFEWDQQVKNALGTVFGKDVFKPNQKAIINCVLSNKDVFACMPTGYGKSITFQIPAYVEDGLSVVVMPLISLIYDQVSYLTNIGIPTMNLSGAARIPSVAQLQNENIKMIYTTPEKIERNDHFKSILAELFQKKLLRRFVIDEAHCVSKWGFDFRPDYLQLKKVRDSYPGVPIQALTATATEDVKKDIIEVLQIKGCQYMQASFNRPNLIYQVRQKERTDKTIQEIKEFINFNYPRQSGIVYCLTQNDCEQTSKSLRGMGIDAAFYHAGLSEQIRTQVHKNWLMNEVQVIVATIAFGMGIDKADCRYVIHYSMPKSIENYYQESGRAGRDGKLAHCVLFFNQNDYAINVKLMDKDDLSAKQKQGNHIMLDQMQKYCHDKETCRREYQLAYFGEKFDRINCNKRCDNCSTDTSEAEVIELTREAKLVLESITNFPLTENQLISCLKGVNDKKQKQNNFQSGTQHIFSLFKANPRYIVPFIGELRQRNLILQNVKQMKVGKFVQKIIMLTSNTFLVNSFSKFNIKLFQQVDKKQSYVETSSRCKGLFEKYLNKDQNKNVNIPNNVNPIINKQWNWSQQQTVPQSLQLTYDSQYGYCTEEQFNDLQERLFLVRKNIYKVTIEQEQMVNIDLVLSNFDIDELCKKLPRNMVELNDSFIRIANEIKKKQYMTQFIDEVHHFVDIESIDKSKFILPKFDEPEQDQVFEYQYHYQDEDDELFEMLASKKSEKQQLIDDILHHSNHSKYEQQNNQYDELLDFIDDIDRQVQEEENNRMILNSIVVPNDEISDPTLVDSQQQEFKKPKLKINLKRNFI